MKTSYIKKNAQLIYIISIILIFSFLSCFVVDPIDNVSNTDFSAKAPFSFDVPVNNQKSISVEGINGPISISGKPGVSSVKIWGDRIVQSDSYDDAEKHLEHLEVLVTDGQNQISVKTDQPTLTYGRSYQVIYNIIIPDNWDVNVENTNGGVQIDSLNGNINLGLVNGDAVITEIYGNISIGVTNGTVYGKVTLLTNGLCTISTVNGQVQLNIPTTTSAELAAQVTNGTVSVSNLALKNMVSSQNSVNGILGTGQGKITIATVNGTISITGF